MKNCINCNQQIPKDSMFCSFCGKKQLDDESVIEANSSISEVECTPQNTEVSEAPSAEIQRNSKRGAKVAMIVRNSVILALAVLVFVGSFFPVNKVDIADIAPLGNALDFDDADITVSFNIFQYITLLSDSFKDAEVEDTEDLEEEAIEITEEFDEFDYQDLENLTAKEKKLFNKIIYLALRIYTQLDKSGPDASLVFCVVLGVLNIVLSAAFLVVALLNMLGTFNIIKSGKAQLYKWTLALLTASPALILAAHYTGNVYLDMQANLSGLAASSLICALATVVFVMVLRYVFATRDSVKNIISRSIALVLSVVVFCLAFAPVISVSFRLSSESSLNSTSKNVALNHDVSFFEHFNVSEEEFEVFDEMRDSTKEAKCKYFNSLLHDYFSDYSKKELKEGLADRDNIDLLLELLGSKYYMPTLQLIAISVVFFILTAIAAMVVLWQSLYFFASGKHSRHVVIISKIFAAAVSVAALVMTIVTKYIIADHAKTYISSSYRIGLSAGVIILVVFAVCAVFCPTRLKAKVRKIKPARVLRDNADFTAQF